MLARQAFMEETKEIKKRRPRSRERGKGKNNKGTSRVSFIVSCREEERQFVFQKAKEYDMSNSKFILECVKAYCKNN